MRFPYEMLQLCACAIGLRFRGGLRVSNVTCEYVTRGTGEI